MGTMTLHDVQWICYTVLQVVVIRTAAAGKSTAVADGWAPAHVKAVKGAIRNKLGEPMLKYCLSAAALSHAKGIPMQTQILIVPQCGTDGQVICCGMIGQIKL